MSKLRERGTIYKPVRSRAFRAVPKAAKAVFLTASRTSLDEIIKQQKEDFHKKNARLLEILEEV